MALGGPAAATRRPPRTVRAMTYPVSPPSDPSEVRGDRRLAIALDVASLDAAVLLAGAVAPFMGVAKVGLELFTAAGPSAIGAVGASRFDVFADLKLHDIPTTVGRAAAEAGRAGARYLTVHAAGGPHMLKAGVDGLAEGSGGAGGVLAVTVLTSDHNRPETELASRAAMAAEAGCAGLICSAADLPIVSDAAPGLIKVVPGIRLPGDPADDQARPAGPAEAIAAGADMLVVGRAVTGPVLAAIDVFDGLLGLLRPALDDAAARAEQVAAALPPAGD